MIIIWDWIVMGLRASSVKGLGSRQAGLYLNQSKKSQGTQTNQRNTYFFLLTTTLFILTVSPSCLDKTEAGIVPKTLWNYFLKLHILFYFLKPFIVSKV